MTKQTTLINNIRECAEACSKDAASVQKECKALYEEVKDFIADCDPDHDYYGDISVEIMLKDGAHLTFSSVKIMLKDGAVLSFNTNMECFYKGGDSSVEVCEEDEKGYPHSSYRDDFVDDCTGYITELYNELEVDNEYDFVDEVNDAGELYYYSLLKTALTVAKERMAKWDGIDHTVDDDEDECEECAE